MWKYYNPVSVFFGKGAFYDLPLRIKGRTYIIVTYADSFFQHKVREIEKIAGKPVLIIDDIEPNPGYGKLSEQCKRFGDFTSGAEVIVALGGGSVIDSAKVFSASGGDFENVRYFLEKKSGSERLGSIPIIAVPTTAGTGSEVTCWATVWDEENKRKFSLSMESLYPESALIDPELMTGKPGNLTLATGLDALSHSLESIWNVNANPVSMRHAVAAARAILQCLPRLMENLRDLDLREKMAEASLNAGLAFSNTKTAIAHNLSYPVTMGWGVQHGIAGSFTLPLILRSLAGEEGDCVKGLTEIFGRDLEKGAELLTAFLKGFGVKDRFADYGISDKECGAIIDEAFAGERGKNFVGGKSNFIETIKKHHSLNL